MVVYDDYTTINIYPSGRGRGRGRPVPSVRPHTTTTTTTMSSDEAERADAPETVEETVEEVRGVLSLARDGWMDGSRDATVEGWMARARAIGGVGLARGVALGIRARGRGISVTREGCDERGR